MDRSLGLVPGDEVDVTRRDCFDRGGERAVHLVLRHLYRLQPQVAEMGGEALQADDVAGDGMDAVDVRIALAAIEDDERIDAFQGQPPDRGDLTGRGRRPFDRLFARHAHLDPRLAKVRCARKCVNLCASRLKLLVKAGSRPVFGSVSPARPVAQIRRTSTHLRDP